MRETSEAMFNTEACLAVSADTLRGLKERAAAAPRRRYRLCLHASGEEPVQEMIIAMAGGSYGRPHCHPTGGASVTLLEGEMSFVTFSPEGAIAAKTRLSPPGGGRPFCVRVAPGVWHMDVVHSPVVVIHEIMAGPFAKDRSNVFAPWAPPETDAAGIADLLRRVAEAPES